MRQAVLSQLQRWRAERCATFLGAKRAHRGARLSRKAAVAATCDLLRAEIRAERERMRASAARPEPAMPSLFSEEFV